MKLKDLKESNHVELAEYAKGNELQFEPAFKWWVPHTLRRRDRILKAMKKRYHRTSQKFGIELPKTVKRALEIDEETGIKANDPEIFFTKTIISTWNRDGIDHERNVVKSYYSVHVDTIDVVLSYEHSEFCWVSLDEAYELLSYDQHKEVVKHAIDNQLEL